VNVLVSEVLRAFALVMVLEGLLPFAAPARWRQVLFTIAQMESRSLRLFGLTSMLAGLVILKLV